jgi:hypothetical protein
MNYLRGNLCGNTLSMLGIAAITMIATLAFLAPRPADAIEGEDARTAKTIVKVTPLISMPKLDEGDCTITMKMSKDSYEAGQKPSLTIEFTNNGKEACEKSVDVSMSSKSLREGGRMPSIARVVWTDIAKVSLAPGETKSVTLEASVAVDADNSFSFTMAGSKAAVEKEAPAAAVSRKQVKN